MSVTSLNRGQVSVVNERVAGTRHLSVSGESPLAHEPYRPGTRSRICLFKGNDLNVRTQSWGREFPDSEAWREHCLTSGYTRPYFTSPRHRLERIIRAKTDLTSAARVLMLRGLNEIDEYTLIRVLARHQRSKRSAS